MKPFKICLDIIPKKLAALTKMHETLMTPPTHLAEHVAQKMVQSV